LLAPGEAAKAEALGLLLLTLLLGEEALWRNGVGGRGAPAGGDEGEGAGGGVGVGCGGGGRRRQGCRGVKVPEPLLLHVDTINYNTYSLCCRQKIMVKDTFR
jgi:hypothetical protein